MEERQVGRQLLGQGVVVREDHGHPQGLGPLQRLPRRHAVVDGDQQADPLGRQNLHHAHIEAVAILLAAGDRRPGPGPQPLQHPAQEGGAGHAIGVVIPTDRHRLAAAAGLLQALLGPLQVGEVAVGIRGGRRIQQGSDRGRIAMAAAAQQRHQFHRQRERLGQHLPLLLGRQGRRQQPALSGGIAEHGVRGTVSALCGPGRGGASP